MASGLTPSAGLELALVCHFHDLYASLGDFYDRHLHPFFPKK
jgi:hypothetical protein